MALRVSHPCSCARLHHSGAHPTSSRSVERAISPACALSVKFSRLTRRPEVITVQHQATKKPFARHLRRVRKICLGLPGATEKMSHGEPTFFVKQGVFAMFSNNHHHGGHVAVLLPAPPGLQEALIDEAPQAYYRPPYVGGSGWIGVELAQVTDEALTAHIA